MPRNVLICCHGTANEFARHRTRDPHAPQHESLAGWSHIAEFVPTKHRDVASGSEGRRRMSRYRRRTIPAGSLVHESAVQRGSTLPAGTMVVPRGAVQPVRP